LKSKPNKNPPEAGNKQTRKMEAECCSKMSSCFHNPKDCPLHSHMVTPVRTTDPAYINYA
jgi:hypothetical protein